MGGAGLASLQSWPESYLKYLGHFKKSLRGQIVTWENLEEKVMEVWNNINPDVVRNLYSSYENRLVKVNKIHGSLTGYWFIICFNSCFKFYSVLCFF